jgi:hypothetical protein
MKISLKLWRQRVLRSSQPIPPAPTRRARILLKSIFSTWVTPIAVIKFGDAKMRTFLKGGSESGLGPECFIEVVTNGHWSLNTKKQVSKIFISKRDKLQCVLTHYF